MPLRFLTNPNTGGFSFGRIPEINTRWQHFPCGEILLPIGKQISHVSGFGAKHRTEMAKLGFKGFQEVPAYVANIIKQGAPLYYEGGKWDAIRLMCVRPNGGTAVFEYTESRELYYWKIITAFSGKKAHGTRVGTVR